MPDADLQDTAAEGLENELLLLALDLCRKARTRLRPFHFVKIDFILISQDVSFGNAHIHAGRLSQQRPWQGLLRSARLPYEAGST